MFFGLDQREGAFAAVALFRVTGFVLNYRGIFWKSEFPPSIRKRVKGTCSSLVFRVGGCKSGTNE
jgi:hypothetical protein